MEEEKSTNDSYNLLKNLTSTSQEKAKDFLKIAYDFKLGGLLTEQPAKETEGLSEFC